MIRNYFKIAWRNLQNNKGYSAINIGGLAVGIAVFMLISLWTWDELSFNKSFDNYDRLGQLYQNRTFNGSTDTYGIVPQPMAKELITNYEAFKAVSLAVRGNHTIAFDGKNISANGMYVENTFPEMFSLDIVEGDGRPWTGIHQIMISTSFQRVLFGNDSSIGQIIKFDNKADLEVKAVYEDFPVNSEFKDINILAPFTFYRSIDEHARNTEHQWGSNDYECFFQINEQANWEDLQAKTKKTLYDKVDDQDKASNPELILHPMPKWRLHSTFVNGINTGGAIELVWLFALIAIFVLILACINFMNLSTARSEKRAKEIGVRKAVGSSKTQLVNQFLSESFLAVSCAFVFALGIVYLSLPFFNELTNKTLLIPVADVVFWTTSIGFIVLTSLFSGSYPAFFLSSIKTVRALKGNYKASRFSHMPRKLLVLLQFTVSVVLIIGTIIVYNQIGYIKDRPIGYDSNGLIYISQNTPELNRINYDLLRNDLFATNVIENMGESSHPIVSSGNLQTGLSWDGMDPASADNLLVNVIKVTHDYGKTVGFQMIDGRDFSRDFGLDESSVILNEKAAALLQKNDVIGEELRQYDSSLKVVGVIKDIINESPFEEILPSIYKLDYAGNEIINIKIKPNVVASHALAEIETVFKQHYPAVPFDFTFVDKAFAEKYADEERLGKLAFIFATLAIFISALGLLGLASFIAEQRRKEIGIRKTLGATVLSLWVLLSRDFAILIFIAITIATPLSWYFMDNWLQHYTFRTDISIWVFILAGLGAVILTLLTVSFHAIKAAKANPINSLKTE